MLRTFAKLHVVGRLTKDPELSRTKNDKPYCKFDLAVNYPKKVGENWEEETLFLRCIAFGNNAEKLVEKGRKGVLVYAEGELRPAEWVTESGEKKKSVILRIDLKYNSLGIIEKGESISETEKDMEDIEF
jgi:single-strand DNA-binding protein